MDFPLKNKVAWVAGGSRGGGGIVNIAAAALFFCSPMAARVTGQSIAVDGGSGEAVID